MNVRVLVFEGADEIDFVGPLEVFRRAAKLVEGVDVRLVTLEASTPANAAVGAAYGLRVVPDGVLDEAVDLLVVPGGGWANHAAQGIRTQIESGLLPARLSELHTRGALLAGVCTGAMALAAAGLLKGRAAVTHRSALADLRSSGAELVEARVVDAGDVVTCGGVSSSLDLALHLVERLWGAEVAERIASGMEYTPKRD